MLMTSTVHVEISDLAARTGASTFLLTHSLPYPTFLPNFQSNSTTAAGWTYSAMGAPNPGADRRTTHLITEAPKFGDIKGWKATDVVSAFTWETDWGIFEDMKTGKLWKGVFVHVSERVLGLWKMKREDMLWILERTG